MSGRGPAPRPPMVMTRSSGCDVLVVGDYYADLVFQDVAEPLRPGRTSVEAGNP